MVISELTTPADLDVPQPITVHWYVEQLVRNYSVFAETVNGSAGVSESFRGNRSRDYTSRERDHLASSARPNSAFGKTALPLYPWPSQAAKLWLDWAVVWKRSEYIVQASEIHTLLSSYFFPWWFANFRTLSVVFVQVTTCTHMHLVQVCLSPRTRMCRQSI